jgi:hypothetical protein
MSNKQQGLIVLGIFLGMALLWFAVQNPQINRINDALAADPEVAAYPYPFHALSVDDGVAVISSPRSTEVSVLQFFKLAFPKLNLGNPDSPEVIAAQKRLAAVQGKVHNITKAQPDIKDVLWQIDRNWYASHGVTLE